jgi:hypothetical protein
MLISSSTDVYSGISQVATASFSDIWGYLILILGIILAFLVIETLLGVFYPDKYPKDEIM